MFCVGGVEYCAVKSAHGGLDETFTDYRTHSAGIVERFHGYVIAQQQSNWRKQPLTCFIFVGCFVTLHVHVTSYDKHKRLNQSRC